MTFIQVWKETQAKDLLLVNQQGNQTDTTSSSKKKLNSNLYGVRCIEMNCK